MQRASTSGRIESGIWAWGIASIHLGLRRSTDDQRVAASSNALLAVAGDVGESGVFGKARITSARVVRPSQIHRLKMNNLDS